jgi:gliding motility-associated-like protein
MKNFFLLLFTILTFAIEGLASGSGCTGTVIPCSDANPFCTSNSYNFPNETSTCTPSGPNYGCLSSTPNPVWYYMEVDQSGTFQIGLSQTSGPNGTGSGLDVDFALYGPFSSLSSGCSSVNGGSNPIQCSYSTAATETLGIGLPGGSPTTTPAAAVAGQVYIVLITNYNGGSGYISFNQTGGTGVADCSIVTPCDMTSLTTSPSACNPATSTYNLTGSIVFVVPPTSGTLTVTNSCGGSQVFNAPFSSPLAYSIPNLPANGSACSVTATFSADNTCTLTTNYTAPAPCTPTCTISSVSATPSSCLAGNTYNLSGSVAFTNPPASGTLTVSNSCGGSQVFNAPFTSPLAYSLNALSANGAACTVTASFSATSCSLSQNYTSPALPTPNAGVDQTVCAGSPVTLTGSGATTYSWSPVITNGTSFTPAATTTYTVTGTNASGCTGTDQVIVTVNPIPVVNAGVDQTVCAGTNVTLAGSGATTYSWNNGVTNGTSFTPAATTTYTVTGTSLGCTATDQVIVTVNPIPVVNAGADVSICIGGSTTLTASGATTYSWSPGGQTTSSISVSPASTTTYTLTGTSLGCTSTDAVNVTVVATAPINAGPDVTLCAGQSTTLTASGGVTYNWDNALGTGNNFTITPASTTTYTVIGTNAGGCTGTDAITVTVNPNPVPVINGASSYCTGNFSTLSTTVPYTTYSWSSGQNTATINATQVNSPFSVTVTNAFGCQATSPTFAVVENSVITTNSSITICQGQSALIHGVNETTAGVYSNTTILPTGCDSVSNVTLIVNPLPTVNAGIDQTVCSGTQITLSGSGANTYSWSNAITNNTPFTPGVGTLTYTLTGTDVNGCINTDQVDVIVNPIPTVNAGNDVAICAGQTVTLSGSGATTYSWNNGVVDGVSFSPVSTTTYTVTGTSLGCTNSDMVTVTVNPIPTVFAGNDVSICDGQSVTLTGSGASTYSWTGGVTNGVTFFPSTIGSTAYTVTGTTAAGCINTDLVNIMVNPLPTVVFSPDVTTGCSPLTVNLTNSTANASNCVWTISNGSTLNGCGTVTTTFTAPGCYDVTLTTTSTNGCVSSLTAANLICIEADPIASFIPSQSILNGFETEVSFQNTTIGASHYLWNFGDTSPSTSTMSPTHDYAEAGYGNYEVLLVAYSPLGCVDSTVGVIQIIEPVIFYVPNTFTPDYDNFNQTFQPIFTSGYDPYDFSMLIFDRWGEVIFETHDAAIGWNGSYGTNGEVELVQDGAYTWKIEFKTTATDERKMLVGHVNVIK